MPTYLGPSPAEIDASVPSPRQRGVSDYDVNALWVVRDDTEEEFIGTVCLVDDATWQEMPDELEINGFTYRIER